MLHQKRKLAKTLVACALLTANSLAPTPCQRARPTARRRAPVIAAVKEVGLKVPLVVRLEGTKVEEGKAIINNSDVDVIAADDLKDGAQKIVKAVKG